MDWQAWLAIALTLGVLITLMVTRLGPHLVMMAALAILSVAGVLGADEVLAGFGNPGLITVAAMFVVAAGLEASGASICWSIICSADPPAYSARSCASPPP